MDLAAGVLHGPAPSPPLPLQLPSPREPGPLHSLPAMLSRHELSSPATGHSLWMLMLSSPRWPPRWPMGISVHPVPPSPVGCPCPAGLVPTTLAPGHSTNCEEGLPAPPRPKPSLLLPQSLAAPQVRPPPTHTQGRCLPGLSIGAHTEPQQTLHRDLRALREQRTKGQWLPPLHPAITGHLRSQRKGRLECRWVCILSPRKTPEDGHPRPRAHLTPQLPARLQPRPSSQESSHRPHHRSHICPDALTDIGRARGPLNQVRTVWGQRPRH